MSEKTLRSVRDYYGRILGSSRDLKTSACCCTDAIPDAAKPFAAVIPDEVVAKFYGCGSPIPPALEGCTVLDLGCGTGRDVFLCAGLAGQSGRVIGVDMTPEQLAVAQRHEATVAAALGYPSPNTSFREGFLEDLAAAGIGDASVDVVISNCVINLAPEKERVFAEMLRVLKPGGEILFADIFADRRLPAELQRDPVLLGECLGGAMYLEDLRRILAKLGVADYRIVSRRPVALGNPEIEAKAGFARFESVTVRAFKLDFLEDRCEDYGQTAGYLGTIAGAPHRFALDDHHVFEAGKPVPVCGNTAAMLGETRLAPHFQVTGDRSIHYGPFLRGPATDPPPVAGGCCC